MGINGISRYSTDSIETLSEESLMALAAMADLNRENQKPDQPPTKSDSYFGELVKQQLETDKSHSRSKRFAFEPADRINSIFSAYEQLTSDFGRQNCNSFTESQRRLPGDVIYGVETQFESQAKLALSIAHFLSSFYQIINPDEDYPLRNAEKSISEENIHAEVIASIGADFQVNYLLQFL